MLANPKSKLELIEGIKMKLLLNSKIKNIMHAEEIARKWVGA